MDPGETRPVTAATSRADHDLADRVTELLSTFRLGSVDAPCWPACARPSSRCRRSGSGYASDGRRQTAIAQVERGRPGHAAARAMRVRHDPARSGASRCCSRRAAPNHCGRLPAGHQPAYRAASHPACARSSSACTREPPPAPVSAAERVARNGPARHLLADWKHRGHADAATRRVPSRLRCLDLYGAGRRADYISSSNAVNGGTFASQNPARPPCWSTST